MEKTRPDKPEPTSLPKEELITDTPESEKAKIAKAVETAIDNYIRSRREKIPSFVNRFFSFKGSLSLHRKGLGKDLYRSPLNIIWALPYTLSRIFAKGLDVYGKKEAAKIIEQIPQGFETDIQKEVKWLIYTELLELPYAIVIKDKDKKSGHDALLNEILEQPGIQDIISSQLSLIHEKSLVPDFRSSLERKIRKYTHSRTVAEDLSESIITLAVGYAAFHTFSPGAVSSGAALASAITKKAAISNFWLGSTVGQWYYGVFPVASSRQLFFISTASIMVLLAFVTTFSGILTDPLQNKLGLHQRRLQQLISSLEKDLKGQQNNKYRIKEQYVARVFDIVDLLRAAAGA